MRVALFVLHQWLMAITGELRNKLALEVRDESGIMIFRRVKPLAEVCASFASTTTSDAFPKFDDHLGRIREKGSLDDFEAVVSVKQAKEAVATRRRSLPLALPPVPLLLKRKLRSRPLMETERKSKRRRRRRR